MEGLIKNTLENIFYVGFDVSRIISDFEEYIIKPKDSYKDTFVIRVKIKDDTRITIEAEPDTYGNYFLENLNLSDANKRKLFNTYWKELGFENITLRINDADYSPESFENDDSKWNKFYLKYTNAPYYNIETEDRNQKIMDNITLICSMLLSIADYSVEGYEEGEKKYVTSIKYERNPINRELCLKANGYKCSVCGMDFEKMYGNIGKNYIEVHHIIPVSDMDHSSFIDPIHDLVPLCPNCHAMIHRRKPPFSVEELREILRNKE